MIAAQVFVTLGIAPRNTRRRYQRAGKCLIFMRQQQVSARPIQLSPITRDSIQCLHVSASAMPLVDKFLAMFHEWNRERLL